MRNILIGAAVFLLAGMQTAGAVRVLEIVENTYELDLTQVTLPRSASGAVTFTPCDTCARESLPVTPSSEYFLVKRSVALAELNAEAARLRQTGADGRTYVSVHYDRETRRVTRIVMQTMPAR